VATVVLALWVAGQLGSHVAGVVNLHTTVHALSLADYAGSAAIRPAPVSPRIINAARHDQGSAAPTAAPPAPAPAARPSATPSTPAVVAPSATVAPVASPAPAVATTSVAGSIGGLVVDSLTNLGIPNASVVLSPGGQTVTTDLSGAFTFTSVAAGSYTLTASATGYASAARTVTVGPGQRVSVTLTLTRTIPKLL